MAGSGDHDALIEALAQYREQPSDPMYAAPFETAPDDGVRFDQRPFFPYAFTPAGVGKMAMGVPGVAYDAVDKPYEAFKRLLASYSPGTGDEQPIRDAATVAGAVALPSAGAARAAAPAAGESIADALARYGKAMALHQRGEVKRGNADGYPMGLGAFGLSTAGAAGAAAAGWPELAALFGSGMIMTRPNSVLMGPHTADVRNIAKYLRGKELREAAAAQPAPARDRPKFSPAAEHDLEIPVSAATKYDDQVFRAPIHGMEEDAAFAALGRERFDKAVTTMGFVTNKGRFVSREEAAALAKAADEKYKPYAYGMDSDDLR